jgi:hypothetical protein
MSGADHAHFSPFLDGSSSRDGLFERDANVLEYLVDGCTCANHVSHAGYLQGADGNRACSGKVRILLATCARGSVAALDTGDATGVVVDVWNDKRRAQRFL